MELVGVNGAKKTCTMNLDIVYSRGKHYSCDEEKSYTCRIKHQDGENNDVKATLATLIVSNLELEMDGNPTKTKEGKFASDQHECNKIT